MRKMGIAALAPKPNTTKPAPGHKIYPYLLRNMTIDRPNQAWAADITYLPIGRGFLYLVAIIDWASRAVLPPPSCSTRWRRHGISRSLLMTWRRAFRPKPTGHQAEQAGFVPAMIVAEPAATVPAVPAKA